MVPLVAARMAATDGVGARQIFRRGLMAALLASTALVLVAIPSIEWLARSFHFEAFAGGTTLMVLALPGISLARLSTAASRATLSMRNEFYSRRLVGTWG